MPEPTACDLLISDAVVIPGDGPALGGVSVAVRGDRIHAIGAAADFAPAHRIDARGGILLPGLVNTHSHTPLMVVRGMVEDLGFAPAYTKGIPQGHWLSAEEAYHLARLGAYELLRAGSTTAVDFYLHPEALARAAAEVGLRAFIGGRIADVDTAELAEGRVRHDPALGEALLAESLDLFARWDGAERGRIRCILAPHAPDTCSRALLKAVGEEARRRDLGLHTHLAQSKGEVEAVRAREGMAPHELLDELGLLNDRLLAAHCIWLEPGEIARVGAAGMNVAHAPIGNAAHGGIAPIMALRDAGANITLCTDTKSADMFESMRLAIGVARVKGAGYAIKTAEVLGWATANGARALGLEGDIGIIRPGAKADLVLLDAEAPNLRPVVDGTGIVVHSGSGANVRTVVIDGRVMLEDGRPTLFDGAEVVREAQKVADGLWRRAGRAPVTG
ncbi:amidohydrolase family protein [Desertibaculum subflavum]|uniref:amidohydrolase family protein n=1 Tax=Desertibaculum subflavum TaxID=2268458 RepID=UPI000E675FDE